MISAFAITFVMIALSVGFHHWGLNSLLRILPETCNRNRNFFRAVGILLLVMGVHLIIILTFSLTFWLAAEVLNLGALGSQEPHGFMDYLYHTSASYTTLGLSHVPFGHLRIMTALESLTGIMLLTWSATFYYTVIIKNSDAA